MSFFTNLRAYFLFFAVTVVNMPFSTAIYAADIQPTATHSSLADLARIQGASDAAEIQKMQDSLLETASGRTLITIDKMQGIILEISSAIETKSITLPDIMGTIQQLAYLRNALELCKKPLLEKQTQPTLIIIENHVLQATAESFQKWIASRCTQLELLTSFSEPLLAWASSDFTDVPPAYLQNFIKRNPVTNVDDVLFTKLEEHIKKTEQVMLTLEQQTTTAGLHWWNKAWRTFEHKIVNRLQKYHIPRLTLKLAATGVILGINAWLVYRVLVTKDILPSETEKGAVTFVEKDYFKQNILERFLGFFFSTDTGLLKFMGEAPFYPVTTPVNMHNHHFRLPGKLLHWFNLMNLHGAAGGINLPQILSLGAIAWLWSSEVKSAYENSGSIKNYILNKLRGGEYNKQAQNGPFGQIESDITFADIIGNESKKEYFDKIIKYLLHPERYDRTGVQPERGILLIGEPGTGKTEFVKALRGELALKLKEENRSPEEINFLTIPASWVMINGIGSLIAAARELAPCIVFIDEFDLLALQRTGDNRNLSETLTFMNGAINMDPPKKRVVFIGATNKIANIDAAVKRSGRFGKHIVFEKPSLQEFEAYLQKRLSRLALNPNDFDIARASQEAAGLTFEDLGKAIRATIVKAQTEGKPFNQASFEQSMDSEVRGILIHDTADLTEQEQKIVAVHIAGHILAQELLHTPELISRATTHRIQIQPREEMPFQSMIKDNNQPQQKLIVSGKIFKYYPEHASRIKSNTDLANEGRILMAGTAAELLCLGDTFEYHMGHGEQNDRHDAFIIARTLVSGGTETDLALLSENKQNEMRDRAYEMVQTWQQDMLTLFTKHKAELDALVAALQEKRTLSNTDIARIIHKTDTTAATKRDEVTGLPLSA